MDSIYSGTLGMSLMPVAGFRPYEPSAEELYQRGANLRWLKSHGFSEPMIIAIMVYDSPTFEFVKTLVERVGPTSAKERIQKYV